MDEYLCGAGRCQRIEELKAHVEASDRKVALWYACMCRGLRARVAGTGRVPCRRWSPGCGVNRRCRSAATLSLRAPLCSELCAQCEGAGSVSCFAHKSSRQARLRLCDAMEIGSVEIKDLGRSFGDKGKCLQKCVLNVLSGEQRRQVAKQLRKDCCNDDGSGFAGTLRESRNFGAVEAALIRQHVCMLVFESESADA